MATTATPSSRIKRTILDGDLVLGTFVLEFMTKGIGRLAAGAGAEFVIFDTEHTGIGYESLGSVIATTRPTTAAPWARIPAIERPAVARTLDAGATGIMVPMVESAEQARSVVSWARYPPEGVRGAAFGIAHDDYRRGDVRATMAAANEDTVIITQVETRAGLEAVDDIAAVDGVDIVWVGHFDLTNSLGIPGQFSHPDYLAALDAVVAAARANVKAAGFLASTVAEAEMLIERGFRVLAYAGDLWLYQDTLAAQLDEVRALD